MKTPAKIPAEKLVGFDAGTKTVRAKVGGKGGIIDAGGLDSAGEED